jgi:hypothetical protein
VKAARRTRPPDWVEAGQFWVNGDGSIRRAGPIIRIRCGACGRQLRRVTLNHSGGLLLLGSLAPDRSGTTMYGTVGGKGHREAAHCYDASPDGWNTERPPTQYRFVCKGKSHQRSWLILSDGLRQRYDAAVKSGNEIILP